MTQKHTPDGMVEVTKSQFYAALEADKRDIMPSVSDPYQTKWETKDRVLWGWNSTGWKSPWGEQDTYWVYPSATAKAEGRG